jgi:polysaccharide pyruvyl transferase WcaK-like protein
MNETAVRRIFVVGLAGAGNLGDDLISALLIPRLSQAFPNAEIGIFMGNYVNPFFPKGLSAQFYRRVPFSQPRGMLRRNRDMNRFLSSADLLVIGAGGLLQDTHHPFSIHYWLRHVSKGNRSKTRIWGVGLGVGPLRFWWSRTFLRTLLPLFDVVQVRDFDSASTLEAIGVRANIALGPDVVAGSDLRVLNLHEMRRTNALGCSFRPWEGLAPSLARDVIEKVWRPADGDIRLFTFENAEPKNISERRFNEDLERLLVADDYKVSTYCYGHGSIDHFWRAFASVERAIAMRFHANVLWQKLSIPVLPISYSPKVTSMYRERSASFSILHVGDMNLEGPLQFLDVDMKESYELPTVDPVTNWHLPKRRGPIPILILTAGGFASLGYRGVSRIFRQAQRVAKL